MTWRSHWSWWTDPRQWLRTILQLEDSPRSIALGTALGVFVALTPTVGIQMVIVMVIALLTKPFLRFNRVAALVAVYLSNPVTVVPIYWFNYRIGTIFLEETVSHSEFARMFRHDQLGGWRQTLQALFFQVGMPLVVGSLVVALFWGLATYPLMLRVCQYVQDRRRARESKSRRSEQSPAEPVVEELS